MFCYCKLIATSLQQDSPHVNYADATKGFGEMSTHHLTTLICVSSVASLIGSAAGAADAAKGPALSTPGWTLCRKAEINSAPETFANVPGGDIFGFTSGTDVGEPGDCGVAFEYSGRAGKADGSYWAGTLKTQFGATIADNFSVALSPFVTHHRIRGVTDLDDASQTRFDGFSGEASYRFIERSAGNPVAATFSLEPRWARVDGTGGSAVTAYSVEFKLFVDAVLVPGKLFGAVNLNYAPATQKADADPTGEWVRSSSTNMSGALTYQINDRLFAGTELRYVTAFEGATLDHKVGEALFGGPTMLVKLSDSTALNIVWTPQMWGRGTTPDRHLDLDNFERHQFRLKLATSF
jgi:hypothetical protein